MDRYCVYAFLREVDSRVAGAGTPYYIGKGLRKRPRSRQRNGTNRPDDLSRIVVLADGLDEPTALELEQWFISGLGRVDLGTGILRNLTNGGDGTSGRICTPTTRNKIREARIGVRRSTESCERQSIARGKPFIVTHPNGNTERIVSLRRFADEHGLQQSHLCRVANGHRSHHKRFKVVPANE